jgi:hypothetical protein
MAPLSVPEQDRRILLRSFWLLISLVIGAIAGFAAWIVHFTPWLIAIAVSVAVGLLAILNEHVVRKLYHAWNNRIIRPLGNFVTAAILRVCLLLIFAATGRAGQRIRLRSDGKTMWAGREPGPNRTSILPFATSATGGQTTNGWIRTYFGWAVRTGNAWAILLIPFFCMLRMVSTEEATGSGGNIYTLF